MVKLFRYTIILICLLALLLLGSGSWILYSPGGTSWLLQRLPEWTGSELTIGQIEGTLGGTLQLKNIELHYQGGYLHLEHFLIENQLLGPLTLEIKQLQAENLQIKSTSKQQNSPPEPFTWPRLPWPLERLQVNINTIDLQAISWQQLDQEPLKIEAVQGDLHWQNSHLYSENFTLRSGELLGSGAFNCGLKRPTLKADVQLETEDSAAGWKKLQLKSDLRQGSRKQILYGPVALEGTTAEGETLTATAELELTPEQLKFRQLELNQPNHPGVITAEGDFDFVQSPPELTGQLQLNQLDLQAETGQPVKLSGTIQIKGNLERYSGQFDLKNHGIGIADAQLAGDFTGTQEIFSLQDLRGQWLGGTLNGQAQFSWSQGWQLKAQLSGKDINPHGLDPQLNGQLNLDLQADIDSGDKGAPQGLLQLQLHHSTLLNHPLTGIAELHWQDNSLQVKQLELHGEGMLLQASGNSAEKLTFTWQIEALEKLLTDAAGKLSGTGWLRWQQQRLTADLHATGEHLAFHDWQLDQFSLQGGKAGAGDTWQLQLTGNLLHNLHLNFDIEQTTIVLNGNLDNHQLSLNLRQQQSNASITLQGGWDGESWRGEIATLQGEDSHLGNWHLSQPVAMILSADQFNIKELSLNGDYGEVLQLQGNYQLKQQHGAAKLHWYNLDLSLFQPFLEDWHISGQSDGSIELEHGQKNLLHTKITASGEVQHQQLELKVTQSEILLDWDESGLQSSLQIILANNGQVKGSLTSAEKNNFIWPQQGSLQLTGDNFPLSIFQPWLLAELEIDGKLDWSGRGDWKEAEPFNLEGEAKVRNGQLHWQEEGGLRSFDITTAELNWQWQHRLQGNVELQLRNHGGFKTSFDLPLAATLPLRFDPDTPINVDLHTNAQSFGLFSLYFPNYIQKSYAQLNLDLQLTGTWQQPILQGDFHLLDAKAFLPSVGIQLDKIELQGKITDNHIEIVKLQCKSGKGKLKGNGHLELQNWYPTNYQLQLKGKNFQLIDLPELQLNATPNLTIEGTGENIKVRGQVKLPYMKIYDQQSAESIINSKDLEIVDSTLLPAKEKRLKYDIDVQLILGKEVFLHAIGINARLGGDLRIQSTRTQKLVGHGKLYVIQGTYSGQGANLEINRGDIYFTGGPLDQPELDILALRRMNEIEVGIIMTGTPQAPVIELYSRPIMQEGDIVSYILTGQPMSASRSQANLIASAASVWFSRNGSNNLPNRLGLDTFYISSDYDDNSGGDSSGENSTTIITAGKYLSPDLYLSLGYSPDTNSDRLQLRYRLTPSWDVESTVGHDAGADLFYRIEFD